MRALFLSPRKAWPPTSGARLRDYHFARALAQKFELTYLFFGAGDDASELRKHLPVEEAAAVPPPQRYTLAKIAQGLIGPTPLPVLNYAGPEMAAAIATASAANPFDVVHLESLHMASYLPAIREAMPDAITVLNWHNIESELMDRFAGNSGSALKGVYARLTVGKLAGLERRLLSDCDAHLVCSERERALLNGWNPNARVALMENGVDTERFRPGGEEHGSRLVFVGQMSYHANIEAAVWFVREIWPAIRSAYPGHRLSIVGSDPDPAVLELAREGEIEVTGTVPDVLPFYQHALAAIVPLQTGGGTRLKILEAMAAGTPVISTSPGAEGLEVTNGRNILIAGHEGSDVAESWVSAMQCIEQPAMRAAICREARGLVCRRYDWSSIGRRLAATYVDWVNSATPSAAARLR